MRKGETPRMTCTCFFHPILRGGSSGQANQAVVWGPMERNGKGAPDDYSLIYFAMTTINPLKPIKARQTPLAGAPSGYRSV